MAENISGDVICSRWYAASSRHDPVLIVTSEAKGRMTPFYVVTPRHDPVLIVTSEGRGRMVLTLC